METNNSLPPDLQHLTRLMHQHAQRHDDIRCIPHGENPRGWTIVTTESPSDTARFARCLLGCEVAMDKDDRYAYIRSPDHEIHVVHPDAMASII